MNSHQIHQINSMQKNATDIGLYGSVSLICNIILLIFVQKIKLSAQMHRCRMHLRKKNQCYQIFWSVFFCWLMKVASLLTITVYLDFSHSK